MPRMRQPGQQIKVWLPQPLYDAIKQDRKDTGRPMAEIARGIIADHYQRLARAAGLDVVMDGHTGVMLTIDADADAEMVIEGLSPHSAG